MLSAYHCVMSTISLLFASSTLLLLLLLRHQSVVSAFQQSRPLLLPPLYTTNSNRIDSVSPLAITSSPSSTAVGVLSRSMSAMNMVRNRGLERLVEGATPLRKFLKMSILKYIMHLLSVAGLASCSGNMLTRFHCLVYHLGCIYFNMYPYTSLYSA